MYQLTTAIQYAARFVRPLNENKRTITDPQLAIRAPWYCGKLHILYIEPALVAMSGQKMSSIAREFSGLFFLEHTNLTPTRIVQIESRPVHA
jgi:hypothetical protein